MRNKLIGLVCVFICATLICCANAIAEGKKTLEDNLLENLFEDWYYVKDTVPDGMLYQNHIFIRIYGDDGLENPEKVEVKAISGDQFLADAVKFAVVDKNDMYFKETHWYNGDDLLGVHINADIPEMHDSNLGAVYFYIDNDVLVKPGEAELEISIETATRQWTGIYYLKVIDYNEYPLFSVMQTEMTLDAEPGNVFSYDEINSSFADFHGDEIWDQINYNEKYIKEITESKGYIWPITYDYDTNVYKVYDLETEKRIDGITVEGNRNFYNLYLTINEYGKYNLEYRTPDFGNVKLIAPITINAAGIYITGEGKAQPGGQIQFSVTGYTEGKTFVWSVDGEHAQIDKDSGLLTIDADAEMGSKWKVTVTSKTGESVSKSIAYERLLESETIKLFDYPLNGILIPEISNWTVSNLFDSGYVYALRNSSNSAWCVARMAAIGDSQYTALCKDADEAKKILEGINLGDDLQNIESKWVEKNGYPVLMATYELNNRSTGFLAYVRNSLMVGLTIWSEDKQVTMQDVEALADYLQYDESQAYFKTTDVELTVSSKGDPVAVTAGKNVQFTSAFANPDAVNKKNANDAVIWSVGNADTGESVEGVTIDAKGQLKVDKNLAAPVNLQVKVASELFNTSATYNISAMPIVSKVILDPAELFFYVGTEDPQTVKASLEPATVPPIGLTWTPAKKDIVEITPVEDGTVSIKPLKAGKTDIAVKEPGGRNAKLTVNVVAPVESVELKANGTAKAGGKVKIAATLAPKNVGNKTVQWSVDVGEDIAKIDEKGQLTISKEAPSGTKITVTCTAIGAPTPVVETMEIEVP